ncbi:zeta toxin family protein [Thiomicrorhabdus aquaedulcis]|uniref:zeta toxin family protein n=1 Tax=Thiomicrorhabdus aquaedulcis TaxID=2211106 RepID=UPI000FD7162D|nr:zeta toxin family protein [Thiomicrorhabdus aquaedulcis]
MKIDDKLRLLKQAKKLIYDTVNLNDADIQENALVFIKTHKNTLFNTFIVYNNKERKAVFLAGSPGAGKTELAMSIANAQGIDRIDTDEIRKLCPNYTGSNAHLFQKASSKGVSFLMDKVFKDEISFILDGNFSDYRLQKENIERSIKRQYSVIIEFVYRPLHIAKLYTVCREEKEGRHVPDLIFYQKFLDSITTLKRIMAEFSVAVDFFDLENDLIIENITDFDSVIEGSDSLKKTLSWLARL